MYKCACNWNEWVSSEANQLKLCNIEYVHVIWYECVLSACKILFEFRSHYPGTRTCIHSKTDQYNAIALNNSQPAADASVLLKRDSMIDEISMMIEYKCEELAWSTIQNETVKKLKKNP